MTTTATTHPERLLEPDWAEITAITPETEDISTFWLRFEALAIQERYRFQPGQFNMLYLPGYGEAAISISSDPDESRRLVGHTIRFVGSVTRAISRLKVGALLGLRGPFGAPWPMHEIEGKDVIIASGGIGLAPLRPAIYHILRHRERYGKVILVYGARRPGSRLRYKGGCSARRTSNPRTGTWCKNRRESQHGR